MGRIEAHHLVDRFRDDAGTGAGNTGAIRGIGIIHGNDDDDDDDDDDDG